MSKKLAGIVAVVIITVAALVIGSQLYRAGPDNGGTPANGSPTRVGFVFLAESQNLSFRAFFALKDPSGNFVRSSGSVNFTIQDARGQALYLKTFTVAQQEFRTYNSISTLGGFLGYSWNISGSEVKRGVPLPNGSGIAKLTFSTPRGVSLTGETASFQVQSLPRTRADVRLVLLGPMSRFLLATVSPRNVTGYSGDRIGLSVFLAFVNIGDEGSKLTNVTELRVKLSVNTPGFVLSPLSLIPPTSNDSVIIQGSGGVQVALSISVPPFSYEGSLEISVDAEAYG